MPLAKGTQVYLVAKVQSVDKRTGQQTIAMPNMEGTIDWAGPGNNGGFRYRVYVPQAGGAVWCSASQIHELGQAPPAFEPPHPEQNYNIGSDYAVDPHAGIRTVPVPSPPRLGNGHTITVPAVDNTLVDTWERRMSAKIFTLENLDDEDAAKSRRMLEWIIDGMIARRV